MIKNGVQKTKKSIFPRLLGGLALAFAFAQTDLAQAQDGHPANVFPPPSPESASYARVGRVRISVAPDRADWTYRVGDRVRFRVTATLDGHPLGGAVLAYTVGPEMLPTEEKQAQLPAKGEPLAIDGGTLKEPGFIRCSVTLQVGEESFRASATAALSPDKIQPTQTDPDDFDAFWTAAKAELAKVAMDPVVTHLPERSTAKADVYHVGIRSAGGYASRVYGILCVPKGEGPFPAVLQVPGAGVYPFNGYLSMAERGAITFQIGIHGIPVNLPNELYRQMGSGVLDWSTGGYPAINLDDRDNYYYRSVYLRCLRANDFLASHPKFDGKNLAVMGGSQGGQLSIVTAALDPRVKALSAFYPAYCDVTGYLHGRAGGWPHMMKPNTDGTPSRHATEAKVRTTGYYDVVNFARRLKVPGNYAWGYNDVVCPPTSMYAAYNVITAPKQLLLALETGHETVPAETKAAEDWLARQLGLEK